MATPNAVRAVEADVEPVPPFATATAVPVQEPAVTAPASLITKLDPVS